MQFFVWMSFIGFYVVYRRGKDISVNFLVVKIGPSMMKVTKIGVPLLIIAIMLVILLQMPTILSRCILFFNFIKFGSNNTKNLCWDRRSN